MKQANIATEEKEAISIVKTVSKGDLDQRRESIFSLEQAMLLIDQVDIPVKHRFSGGIYAREITIPKGTLLTGRIHKFDHFDIMLSGDISVSTDTGEVKRLTGLNIMEGKAGKKRAGYAHEDTHWITFHSAEERDPEEMYEFLTCGSFEELEDFNIMLDNSDYSLMLQDLNLTEEQIQEVVTNKNDMIELDKKFNVLEVKPSKIQGDGIFTNRHLPINLEICPARIDDKRTIAGRYTNHSFNPNCKMVVKDNLVILVSLKTIEAGQELTVNYREVFEERISKGDL